LLLTEFAARASVSGALLVIFTFSLRYIEIAILRIEQLRTAALYKSKRSPSSSPGWHGCHDEDRNFRRSDLLGLAPSGEFRTPRSMAKCSEADGMKEADW
jgi:hypothetical protein